MFRALKEFALGDRLVQAGEVVETASARMIELGLVEQITGEVQEVQTQVQKTEKPKKEKKAKEETKVEEVQVQETTEQILTEDSAEVTVEKTEE